MTKTTSLEELKERPNWIRAMFALYPRDDDARLSDNHFMQLQVVGPHIDTMEKGPWKLVVETYDQGTWERSIPQDVAEILMNS